MKIKFCKLHYAAFATTYLISAPVFAMQGSPWGEFGGAINEAEHKNRTCHLRLKHPYANIPIPTGPCSFIKIENLDTFADAQQLSDAVCDLIKKGKPTALAMDNQSFSNLQPILTACQSEDVQYLRMGVKAIKVDECGAIAGINTLQSLELFSIDSGSLRHLESSYVNPFTSLKSLYLTVGDESCLDPLFKLMGKFPNLEKLKVEASRDLCSRVSKKGSHRHLKTLSLRGGDAVSDLLDVLKKTNFQALTRNYPALEEFRLGQIGDAEGTPIHVTRPGEKPVLSFRDFKLSTNLGNYLFDKQTKFQGLSLEFKDREGFMGTFYRTTIEEKERKFLDISRFITFVQPTIPGHEFLSIGALGIDNIGADYSNSFASLKELHLTLTHLNYLTDLFKLMGKFRNLETLKVDAWQDYCSRVSNEGGHLHLKTLSLRGRDDVRCPSDVLKKTNFQALTRNYPALAEFRLGQMDGAEGTPIHVVRCGQKPVLSFRDYELNVGLGNYLFNNKTTFQDLILEFKDEKEFMGCFHGSFDRDDRFCAISPFLKFVKSVEYAVLPAAAAASLTKGEPQRKDKLPETVDSAAAAVAPINTSPGHKFLSIGRLGIDNIGADYSNSFASLKELHLTLTHLNYLTDLFKLMGKFRNLETLKVDAWLDYYSRVSNEGKHPHLKTLSLRSGYDVGGLSRVFNKTNFQALTQNYPALEEFRLGQMDGAEGTPIHVVRGGQKPVLSFRDYELNVGLGSYLFDNKTQFQDLILEFKGKKEFMRTFYCLKEDETPEYCLSAISPSIIFVQPVEYVFWSGASPLTKTWDNRKKRLPESVLVAFSNEIVEEKRDSKMPGRLYGRVGAETTEEDFIETVRNHCPDILFTPEELKMDIAKEFTLDIPEKLKLRLGELKLTPEELQLKPGQLQLAPGQLKLTPEQLELTLGELRQLGLITSQLKLTHKQLKLTMEELKLTPEQLKLIPGQLKFGIYLDDIEPRAKELYRLAISLEDANPNSIYED